jgi:endogenous inhibitor of DNA gyrase (YacG/DUF329 family)
MIRGRCPICGKGFEAANLDAWPAFPFCSERCRLVDLGRWIDESYVVPGRTAEPEADVPPNDEEGDE